LNPWWLRPTAESATEKPEENAKEEDAGAKAGSAPEKQSSRPAPKGEAARSETEGGERPRERRPSRSRREREGRKEVEARREGREPESPEPEGRREAREGGTGAGAATAVGEGGEREGRREGREAGSRRAAEGRREGRGGEGREREAREAESREGEAPEAENRREGRGREGREGARRGGAAAVAGEGHEGEGREGETRRGGREVGRAAGAGVGADQGRREGREGEGRDSESRREGREAGRRDSEGRREGRENEGRREGRAAEPARRRDRDEGRRDAEPRREREGRGGDANGRHGGERTRLELAFDDDITPAEIAEIRREILSPPERTLSVADERKIALFCDLENIALGVRDSEIKKFDINLVLERLLEKGKIIVKKAYCDWERYSDYKRPFHEAAIELIDIPQKYYSGKNSADIKMVVDAMDLSYSKEHLDTFVVLSGDSDFSPLVSKLKENNKTVIGIGVKGSSSALLVDNCDEFIYYEDIWRDRQRTPTVEAPDKKKNEAFRLMVDAMQALLRDNKDVLWGSMIKQTMQRKKPSFSEGYYGYSTFSELLEDAERNNLVKLKKDQRSGTYIVTGFAGGKR